MKNKFDELAKEMAQSGGRGQALKKFGASLAAVALNGPEAMRRKES